MDQTLLDQVFGIMQKPKKKRKPKKRSRFQILQEAASKRNMVLERNRRLIAGTYYNYDVYNNTTFTGDACRNLDEVYDVVFSEPIPGE